MEKSENINEIAKALVQFQNEKPQIDLNSTVEVKLKSGGSYFFKYATLAHVLKEIQPALHKCSIAYSQILESDDSLSTMLIHGESGQYITSNKNLNLPSGATAQEVGSFITYYKRYSLLSMLGVVAEDDEDGNIASGNDAKKTENNNPWLNKYKKGSKEVLPEYTKIVTHAKAKKLSVKDLRAHYKINKEVATELENDLK